MSNEIKDPKVEGQTNTGINKVEDNYLDNIKDALKNSVPKEQYEKETKRLAEDNKRLSELVSELAKGNIRHQEGEVKDRDYKEIYKDFTSGSQLKPLSNMEMMKLMVETYYKALKDGYGQVVDPQLIEDIEEALALSDGDQTLFNGYMKSKYPAESKFDKVSRGY